MSKANPELIGGCIGIILWASFWIFVIYAIIHFVLKYW